MNSQVEYRRHGYRPADPVSVAAPAHDRDASAGTLAHHRDPAVARGAPVQPPEALGVTWVRPTELAAYATPIVGRGIDLQADLVRRARHTSRATARALPRLIPHPTPPTRTPASIPQPTPPPPPAARTEGPSL